ncbi:MAG: hypothetical protein AABX11_05570 [Nanoarchaeota archaeon]
MEFVAGDLVYKYEGFWKQLPRQRFQFEQLGFYEPVEEKDLPWNNGEKWYFEAPWAGISRGTIDKWLLSRETLDKHR